MLPLVLSTGPGSELYRGLGSILLGGLAVSTVFTLFVIPCLLSLFIGFEKVRDHAA
jgi:HAE1 family hydrophobic/amphiphilic exporter-1